MLRCKPQWIIRSLESTKMSSLDLDDPSHGSDEKDTSAKTDEGVDESKIGPY